MANPESRSVESTLSKPELHLQWERLYRTVENARFYEEVFDYIVRVLNPQHCSTILDVGCGTCAHSIRLANRGFQVQAVDFSESVLKMARENMRVRGLESRIQLERQDLLSLSFEAGSFDFVLCWGVLMHIPDVEKAVSELARVTKVGGTIIIGEANMHSLQSVIVRNLRRLLRREKGSVKGTPAGMEYWTISTAGTLLTRQANINWLVSEFASHGFIVKEWIAGQFTEAYTRVGSPVGRSLIQRFNILWFKYVRIPSMAFTNILIFEKGE